jgi:hypothetical protein
MGRKRNLKQLGGCLLFGDSSSAAAGAFHLEQKKHNQ